MAKRKRKKRSARQRKRRRVRYLLLGVLGLLLLRWLDFGAPKEADLGSEKEALARVIRSEMGVGTEEQKLHVAWAVRNLAQKRGQTIVAMACSPCGAQGAERPVSSKQEATPGDRKLARRVLRAALSTDPTGGATHFINPRLQDALHKRGRAGYRGKSYARVRKRWIKVYGWEPYYRLGPTLEMWGPKQKSASAGRAPEET